MSNPARPVTPEELTAVLELRDDGMTNLNVSLKLGISISRVQTIIKVAIDNGETEARVKGRVYVRRLPMSLQARQQAYNLKFKTIIDLRLRGMGYLEISSHVDMTVSDVRLVVERAIKEGYQITRETGVYKFKKSFSGEIEKEKRTVIAPKVTHLSKQFRKIATARASDKAPKPERKSPKTVKVGNSGFYTTPNFAKFLAFSKLICP